MTATLTDTHVEEVRRICAAYRTLHVTDVRLSEGGTQVLVSVERLTVDPLTVVRNLYRIMLNEGTDLYSVTHVNQPGQPCELLVFGALRP